MTIFFTLFGLKVELVGVGRSGGRLVDFTVWDRGGQVFVVCTLEVGEEL